MTVREAMTKIRAARETANVLHKMGEDRPEPGIFWDAEELLLDFVKLLENMEVKTNE
jgi:hypothetical protein